MNESRGQIGKARKKVEQSKLPMDNLWQAPQNTNGERKQIIGLCGNDHKNMIKIALPVGHQTFEELICPIYASQNEFDLSAANAFLMFLLIFSGNSRSKKKVYFPEGLY